MDHSRGELEGDVGYFSVTVVSGGGFRHSFLSVKPVSKVLQMQFQFNPSNPAGATLRL